MQKEEAEPHEIISTAKPRSQLMTAKPNKKKISKKKNSKKEKNPVAPRSLTSWPEIFNQNKPTAPTGSPFGPQ